MFLQSNPQKSTCMFIRIWNKSETLLVFKLQTMSRFWRQWQWEGKKQRGGNAADALVWLCRHVPLLPLDHDFKSKIAKRFHLIHLIHVICIHFHINLKLNKALCIKISCKSPSGQVWQNPLLLQGEDVEGGGWSWAAIQWGGHLTPRTHSPSPRPSFPSSFFSFLRSGYVGRRSTTSLINCE